SWHPSGPGSATCGPASRATTASSSSASATATAASRSDAMAARPRSAAVAGAVALGVALSLGGLAAAAERADLTPLLSAARAFDHATVLALVREGADVHAAEADGTTALHWAAAAGDAAL